MMVFNLVHELMSGMLYPIFLLHVPSRSWLLQCQAEAELRVWWMNEAVCCHDLECARWCGILSCYILQHYLRIRTILHEMRRSLSEITLHFYSMFPCFLQMKFLSTNNLALPLLQSLARCIPYFLEQTKTGEKAKTLRKNNTIPHDIFCWITFWQEEAEECCALLHVVHQTNKLSLRIRDTSKKDEMGTVLCRINGLWVRRVLLS